MDLRMLAVAALTILIGCSRSQEVKLPTVEKLSPQAKELLLVAWPKMKTKLPGLNKYGNAVTVVDIQDFLNNDPEYRKLTIELVVPDGESDVPSEYKAWGNHCFVDISSDGQTASFTKRACKAVLLDQNVFGTEHDNGDNLVIQLN